MKYGLDFWSFLKGGLGGAAASVTLSRLKRTPKSHEQEAGRTDELVIYRYHRESDSNKKRMNDLQYGLFNYGKFN